MAELEQGAVRLMRHNRLLLGLALAVVAVGLAGFHFDVGLEVGQWPLLIALTVTPVGCVLLRYLWAHNPRPVAVPGKLSIDDESLRFGGRVLCKRAHIENGLVVASQDRHVVRLELGWRRGPIELAAADEAAAHGLLATLGLGRARTTFRLASPTAQGAWTRGVMYGALPLFIMTAGWLGWAAWAWIAIFVVLYVLSKVPARAIVGSDGITTRWLHRRAFIGHGEIHRAVRYGSGNRQGIQLVRGDGTSSKLPTPPMFTSEIADAASARLLQQVERARKAHRPKSSFVEVLEQSAAEPGDWVRGLLAVGSGGRADHRTPALREEDLWRVVEDAHAAPRARGGAAIALSAQLDCEGRERLRSVARGTASEEVRQAIEAAAEEEASEQSLVAAASPLLRISSTH